MPQALAFTLSLSSCFLHFSFLFSSAATLPPSTSNPDIPPTLSLPTNLTTNLTAPNGEIRCVLPYPHATDPVNLRTCQPTIDRLLSYSFADTPRTYRFPEEGRKRLIEITQTVCVISLDRQSRYGEIIISLSQIVQSVVRTLTFCSRHGEGGWQFLDPPSEDWIVIVQGNRALEEVGSGGNGTVDGGLVALTADE